MMIIDVDDDNVSFWSDFQPQTVKVKKYPVEVGRFDEIKRI